MEGGYAHEDRRGKEGPSLDTEWNADMYMQECEHRVYEVEIGDGGGITRKTEPGQAGPRERGGYAGQAARAGRGCCAPLARLRRGPCTWAGRAA